MQLRELYTDDRAVSPVVGVALLIAIAVILAAVIGAVVLGLGTGGVDTPQAQTQADFTTNDLEVEISHQGGEPIPADEVTVIAESENEQDSSELFDWVDGVGEDDELTAGETYALNATELADGSDIDSQDERIGKVTLVWEDPNSDSETVLEEFEE